MKQLVCEMCGSTDLVKQDGVFVCQTCGCKYSIEEARKMMIDGVVEVTGTVTVDNSAKTEKMLVNAKRAFDDGKFSDAQSLYGQILNEDPENPTAILYQGLSLGWQGNTVRYYMDKTGAATERAIEIAHKQMGDGEEFATFAEDALDRTATIAQALVNLCIKNISQAAERGNREISIMRSTTSIYSDHSSNIRRTNEAMERMNNEANKQYKLIDNTFLIVLSAYQKALECLSNVENYSVPYYKKIQLYLTKLAGLGGSLKSTVFVSKANRLSKTVDNYLSKKEDIVAAEKRKKIEAYWEQHQEEKKALEDERKRLETEKKDLEKQEKEYIEKEKSLKKESEKKVPAAEESGEIKQRMSQLSSERARLGIFKGKEKKALDAQISELKNKIDSLEAEIKRQEADQKNDFGKRITELQAKKGPITDRLKAIKNRESQIERELTRDR